MDNLAAIFINEDFTEPSVAPQEFDRLLARGWRHFGPQFFRYNLAIYENEIRQVIPLRIRLSGFSLSKSLRRVLRNNADTSVEIGPVAVTPELQHLFDRHKRRFKQHPPDSIHTFIAEDSRTEPCQTFQQSVRVGGKLLSAGFFDTGERSMSGIYTAFEPTETRRSLGIFTILKEIEHAIESGKEFYYQGYCYSGNSFYDYKKRFRGTEAYDWKDRWRPIAQDR